LPSWGAALLRPDKDCETGMLGGSKKKKGGPENRTALLD
jgi:hypothetical protein